MSYYVTQMVDRDDYPTTSVPDPDNPYIIALNGTPEKLEQLFKEGIDPNGITLRAGRDNIVAFHMLVDGWEMERIGKIELFLRYGMNPNLKDEKGRTALVNLCYLGLYIDLYINPRTDSENLDKEQKKIEHWKRMFRTLIHLLISQGADSNIPDNEGNTCLHYCVEHNPFYFQILEQYGADRTIRNNKGKTPYDKYLSLPRWQKDVNKEYEQIFSVGSLFDCSKRTINIMGVDISKLPPVFSS